MLDRNTPRDIREELYRALVSFTVGGVFDVGRTALDTIGGKTADDGMKSSQESGIIKSNNNRKNVKGYGTTLNIGQQNKHIIGTNEYKIALQNGQTKSVMYGDIFNIQTLLNNYAGTGEVVGKNNERVEFEKIIGKYIDPNAGAEIETTIGIIHYGKRGAHIVPARPNQGEVLWTK